jgi:hypothetical protein
LDGQARRRLADIFIGGSLDGHECQTAVGETILVSYAYQGFQHTQLLMPYAGIIQSSQYVYYRRQDIGFRHDCLGRDGEGFFQEISAHINRVWKRAPVVYELCGPNEADIENIQWLLQVSHPSLVHDNQWTYSRDQLEQMLLNVGYRYFLKSADFNIDSRTIALKLEWQNVGSAPNYPRMGQEFTLYFYLLDSSDEPVYREIIPVDTSLWLPASEVHQTQPSYWVTHDVELPTSLVPGMYQMGVALLDERTSKPIQLAFDGKDVDGTRVLSMITIP